MICIGSGQQRYQFKEQRGSRNIVNRDLVTPALTSLAEENAVTEVPRTPNSEITLLASAFIGTIKWSTSLKYNLAWAYGLFLEDVPQRLGINKALDASAAALLSAHSSFCSHRRVGIEGLTKYSHALMILRECLDDPVTACASETLCAVMLLLICQVSQTGRFPS
jgi:hypothetical protein